MGLLRLLFALSVLIFHAGLLFNYNIANSTVAVLSFFVISGFYMALILDKKYAKKPVFLFWSNRFLRIFPLYWLTLFMMVFLTLIKLVFHIGADNAITHYIHWSPQTTPLLFGLDLFNFIIRNLTLIVNFDYFRVNNNTPGYLLVQQAWTLQLELLFYLTAPFWMRLSKKALLIVFLLYVVGFFGFIVPFHLLKPNLIYVFLSYLVYFLLGMMSFRFLYKRFQVSKPHPRITKSVFFFFILYLLFYNLLPFKFPLSFLHINNSLYYIILLISIPFIFLQTSSAVIDNFIGKLSYPVYIVHFLVIKALSNFASFKSESTERTVLVIILTLMTSYIMVKMIEMPIDKFRQARVKISSSKPVK